MCSETIDQICPFLQFCFHESPEISKHFSGVKALNLTKVVHDVATFNVLLSYKLSIGVPIFQSVLEWQCDKENLFVKNANFATLMACHGNIP